MSDYPRTPLTNEQWENLSREYEGFVFEDETRSKRSEISVEPVDREDMLPEAYHNGVYVSVTGQDQYGYLSEADAVDFANTILRTVTEQRLAALRVRPAPLTDPVAVAEDAQTEGCCPRCCDPVEDVRCHSCDCPTAAKVDPEDQHEFKPFEDKPSFCWICGLRKGASVHWKPCTDPDCEIHGNDDDDLLRAAQDLGIDLSAPAPEMSDDELLRIADELFEDDDNLCPCDDCVEIREEADKPLTEGERKAALRRLIEAEAWRAREAGL